MTIETHAAMVQRLKSDDYVTIMGRMTASREMIDTAHAIMGIDTEGAELSDALKRHYFYGTPLDKVNLKEEVGDLMYYIQLLAQANGFTIEEAMDTNEAKLNARYGDKFSEESAVNRDLDKEREILEEGDWIVNDGKVESPPHTTDVLVDVEHRDGSKFYAVSCGTDYATYWGHLDLDQDDSDIMKWRLTK